MRRSALTLLLVALMVVCVFAPQANAADPPADWPQYFNASYGWALHYPVGWHVNQGVFQPAPPMGVKFSTYRAETSQTIDLTPSDAEVWVTVSEDASAAALPDWAAKGYTEREITVSGLAAKRYTAPKPAFGLYDAVILPVEGRLYRIYLSAASHDFDATFQTLLDSLEITALFRHPQGLSARYPVSWSVQEIEGGARFLPAGSATVEPAVAVVFEVLSQPAAGRSATEAFAASLEQRQSQGAIEKLELAWKPTQLAGLSAQQARYTCVEKASGKERAGAAVSLRLDGTIYMVRFEGPAEENAAWLTTFERLAQSFRVQDLATVSDLLAAPAVYQGKTVTVVATFKGQSTGSASTQAGVVGSVEQDGVSLAVRAGEQPARGLQPATLEAAGRLRVTGVVKLSPDGQPYVECTSVYPEVAGLWGGTDKAAKQVLALELTQVAGELAGELTVTNAEAMAVRIPLSGALDDAGQVTLHSTSEAAQKVELRLSSDGKALQGNWSGMNPESGALTLQAGQLGALPETGADLTHVSPWPLLGAGLALLTALGLGIGLVFRAGAMGEDWPFGRA